MTKIRDLQIGPYLFEVFAEFPEPLSEVEAGSTLQVSDVQVNPAQLTFLVAYDLQETRCLVRWTTRIDQDTYMLVQRYDLTADVPSDLPCCVVKFVCADKVQLLDEITASNVLRTMKQEIQKCLESLGEDEAFEDNSTKVKRLFGRAAVEG